MPLCSLAVDHSVLTTVYAVTQHSVTLNHSVLDNGVPVHAGLRDRHAEQQHQAARQQQLAFPDHDCIQSCSAEDNLDATQASMCRTPG